MLKNTKITTKLILLVLPLILSLLAFLVFFAWRTSQISSDSKQTLFDEAYNCSTALLKADRNLYRAALAEKELFLLGTIMPTEERDALISEYMLNASEALDLVNEALSIISRNSFLYERYNHPLTGKTTRELGVAFNEDFLKWDSLYDHKLGSGNTAAKFIAFETVRETISQLIDIVWEYADTRSGEILSEVRVSIVFSVAVVVLIILLLSLFAIYIIFSIRNSLGYITSVSNRIAQGELAIEIDRKQCSKDELGQLCTAVGRILSRLSGYVDYIGEITEVLGVMAQGDMRVSLKYDYAGEFAPIREALLRISTELGGTLAVIGQSAEQVNTGASQIAGASQSISQAATQQASSIEELSASLAEVSEQIKNTAENVGAAAEYVQQSNTGVDKSNRHMEDMLSAMKEINESSSQISKIIRVIDDIAFQTNILALNAAVEAARAGAAGKGFAVVADEVRNLASKSADAAKQTSSLIEGSIISVGQGTRIAEETAKALADVREKSIELSSSIEKIRSASTEQAASISQITQGVEQISMAVQTNSATAQQSAATSQELSGQASLLRTELSRFILADKQEPEKAEEIPMLSEPVVEPKRKKEKKKKVSINLLEEPKYSI